MPMVIRLILLQKFADSLSLIIFSILSCRAIQHRLACPTHRLSQQRPVVHRRKVRPV